jgi:predicted heme/steroid binding protein
MTESTPRRRKPSSPPSKTSTDTKVEPEDAQAPIISRLDILRVILTLLAATLGLSYYLTTTLTFGYSPWWLSPSRVTSYLRGPLSFTPQQLLQYNGSDPSLPIYLAVNGTVFDVTAGKHTYGPGGSYSVFAGYDASRAFVTGCFLDDRTSDLRGAEMLYIPIEDDTEEVVSSGERKLRAERERREARRKVQAEVKKWVEFYRNHKKYFEVGKVVDVPAYGDEVKILCEAADKGRPKRSQMNKKKRKKEGEGEGAAPGKPVQ